MLFPSAKGLFILKGSILAVFTEIDLHFKYVSLSVRAPGEITAVSKDIPSSKGGQAYTIDPLKSDIYLFCQNLQTAQG